jgi:hypothetical protein
MHHRTLRQSPAPTFAPLQLLNAARTIAEAQEMARAFYLVDEQPPLRYRFAAQPGTEVSGPGGVPYRIVLRRVPDAGVACIDEVTI